MKKFLLNLFGLFIVVTATSTWGYTPEDCIRCHKDESHESKLHVAIEKYSVSIHGRGEITCLDCHTSVRDKRHETIKELGIVDCTTCHDKKNRHGLVDGASHRPQCYSCHSRHAIFEKESESSTVHWKNLKKVCNSCHPAECGNSNCLPWLTSFHISSHKKGDFGRSFNKDNCLGCHQGRAAHGEGILLNDNDCYKCHVSLEGKPLLLGYIHPKEDTDTYPTIFAVNSVYLLLILAFFFGGFAFFVQKFSPKKRRPKEKDRC